MEKTVLRFIGEKEVSRYLVPKEARLALGYPPSCLEQGEASCDEMVGMSNASCNYEYGRQRRRTREDQVGENLSRLIICTRGLEVIFKADRETPLKDQIGRQEEKAILRSQVQTAIAGKIVVGYNLGPLLTKLQISHSRFIDVAHLYPEVTPKKQPLSRLAREILGVKMTHQGKHQRQRYPYGRGMWDGCYDPDSSDEQSRHQRRNKRLNPRNEDTGRFVISSEAANVCLKIAEKHIQEGRGILTSEPTGKGEFRNVDEMLEQAGIKKEEVCGLFLRGSRAMDIHVVHEDYKSDWDYVCVLDTSAVINSILVRLPYVDLLLFDRRSFMIYVNGGDLPMIELFFLPSHCIYVNHLPRPTFSIRNSKYSLIYHMHKADEKIKYYSSTFYQSFFPNRNYHLTPSFREDRPQEDARVGERGRRNRNATASQNHELLEMQGSKVGSNDNPKYVQWKFIKIMHMQVRFLDIYLQIRQNGRIIDPLAKTPFWKQLQTICLTRGHFAAYQVCKDEVNRLLAQAFSLNQLQELCFTLFKDQPDNHLQYQRRTYRDRRGYRQGREYPGRMRPQYRGRTRYNHYPRYSRSGQEDYQILSLYRRIAPVSHDHYRTDIRRIDDVESDEYFIGGWSRRGQRRKHEGNPISPQMMLLNTTTLDKAVLKQSPFLKILRNEANQDYSQIQTQLSPHFLEVQNFYSINYIQRQGRQPPQEEITSLIKFIPQEHANIDAELVQEASASIMRCYLTELQEKTAVYTLVCFTYKPFLEYASIKADREAVSAFQAREFDVFEKRDGVLAALYFSGAGWVVGTKGTPDGREHISPGKDLTVFDEFSRVFRQLGYKLPEERHRNKAFLFQLLSIKISNTIPKGKDELILHGVRNMRTLQEEDPEYYAGEYGWTCASTIPLDSKRLQEMAQVVESRTDCEGFILRDRDYNRLIIRNSSILKKKWQKDMQEILQQPQQALIDANKKVYFLYSRVVLKKRHQEYLQLFPEDQEIIQGILQYLQDVSSECLRLSEQIGKRGLQQAEVDELIVDKPIHILTYLLSQRTREQNNIPSTSLHTSINFQQAFTFILQHLYNRTLPA